jgi:hypothetical protein
MSAIVMVAPGVVIMMALVVPFRVLPEVLVVVSVTIIVPVMMIIRMIIAVEPPQREDTVVRLDRGRDAEAQAGSQQRRTDEGADFHDAAPELVVSMTANAEPRVWLTGCHDYPGSQWPMVWPVRMA